MNQNEIILALYTVMFIFVVFMGTKIYKARKLIEGREVQFSQKVKILQYILIGLLMSLIFLVDMLYLRLLLVGISTYFIYITFEKISLSDGGIYFNGKFDEWSEVKQWTFNPKNGNLILTLSKPKPNDTRFLPTRAEDRDEINNLIRSYKNKKKNRKNG